MKVNKFNVVCLLSIWTLLLQQFVVGFLFSPIKLYMIWTVLLVLIAIIYRFNNYYKLLLFEYSFILFCILLLVTLIWADVPSKSVTLLLGIYLLVTVMIVYRGVFSNVENSILNDLIEKSFNFYALISIIYYVFGLILHYVYDVQPTGLGYDSRSIGGLYLDGAIPRLRGLAESPNNFGLYIIIGICHLLFAPTKKMLQLTVMIVSVLLTFSITSYIMVLFVAMFYIFTASNGRIKFLLLWFGFGLILVYIIYSIEGIEEIVNTRVTRIFTGSGRFELWRYCFELIEAKPFFGYGLNQSRVLLESVRGYQSTHNAILEVLITGGLFLLVFYFIFWMMLFITVVKIYLRQGTGRFLFPLTISYFISSMSNVVIFTESFIFILALISAYSIKKK